MIWAVGFHWHCRWDIIINCVCKAYEATDVNIVIAVSTEAVGYLLASFKIVRLFRGKIEEKFNVDLKRWNAFNISSIIIK
jgi:hypothetical protein